jgi:signal transduction histidine kinase
MYLVEKRVFEARKEERLHKDKVVSITSDISDKLNSPLLSVQNILEMIQRKLQEHEQSMEQNSFERCLKMIQNGFENIEDLKSLSRELSSLRDFSDIEATMSLKK